MKWIESGSPASPIWLVGEAPGQHEVEQGRPLCGPSGLELDKMLQEAGWPRTQFFKTNVCHQRPPSYNRNGKWIHNDIDQWFATATAAKREGLPTINGRHPRQPILVGLDRLSTLAKQYHPRLIIALGGSALWALCGADGITKWRGSVLNAGEDYSRAKVLATLHPSIIVDPTKGQYTYRPIVIQDLRRALREASTCGDKEALMALRYRSYPRGYPGVAYATHPFWYTVGVGYGRLGSSGLHRVRLLTDRGYLHPLCQRRTEYRPLIGKAKMTK